MISHSHKTIFVHIPKAGGQSIESMFLQHSGLDWNTRATLLLRKKNKTEKGPLRLAHLKASEYVSFGYVSNDVFNTYFKFSFVRNPYKRVFSFYTYLGYSKIMTLETFVKKVIPKKMIEKDFFFISQYDYLYTSEGNLLVDFVGKLENITNDIEYVKEKSGINNIELPHLNKSKGEWNRVLSLLFKNPTYFNFYLFNQKTNKKFEQHINPQIKEIIHTMYNKDFIFFNYPK